MKVNVKRIVVGVLECVLILTIILAVKNTKEANRELIWDYPDYPLVNSGRLQPYQGSIVDGDTIAQFCSNFPEISVIVRYEENKQGDVVSNCTDFGRYGDKVFKCVILQVDNTYQAYFSQAYSEE